MEKVIGFTYNGHRYIYQRNIQGDIIRIYDVETDEVVAEYSYDAWGNQNVNNKNEDNIGDINPIRYRGYYYDNETGLYYLNARYYDPKLGRFISPDTLSILDDTMGEINGLNLYMYCKDNPVMYADPSGHFGVLALVAITVASMLIGGADQLVSNAIAGKTGGELWSGVVGSAIGTGINALVMCLTMPLGGASLFIAAGASAIAQTAVDTFENAIRGETIDIGQTFIGLGLNFAATLAGNILGTKMIPTNSGWLQTQKFWSVFTKPYGQKILLQNIIGAGLSGTINFIKKNDWSKHKFIITVPVLPLY